VHLGGVPRAAHSDGVADQRERSCYGSIQIFAIRLTNARAASYTAELTGPQRGGRGGDHRAAYLAILVARLMGMRMSGAPTRSTDSPGDDRRTEKLGRMTTAARPCVAGAAGR
jgi:hypothetical protein